MNERIKQLAEQAGVPKEYSFVEGATVWSMHPSLEQFAYLIIQECAGLVEDHYDDGDDNSLAGYKIRKHFGLEK